MFKKISVLALLCVSQLGFSQSEATTTSTTKKQRQSHFSMLFYRMFRFHKETLFSDQQIVVQMQLLRQH